MDAFARFLTPVIKDLIKLGLIIYDENMERYFIEAKSRSFAKGAIFMLKRLWNCTFGSFFFSLEQEKSKTDNTIVEVLFNALDTLENFCYETIKSFIEGAIAFLKRLYRGGVEFTYKMANLARGYLNPSSCISRLPAKSNYNKDDDMQQARSVKNEVKTIATIKETRSVNLNIEATPKNNSDLGTGNYIVGSRSEKNSKFKGVVKKYFYHVGNVDNGTSNDDVLQYLDILIPDGDFTCQTMSLNKHCKSFKIGANYSDKSALEKPTSWPEGVKISSFQFKKKDDNINDKSIPVNQTTSYPVRSFQQQKGDYVKFTGERKIGSTKFIAAEHKCWYYVGRVIRGTSEQDIINYMKQRIPNGKFTCKQLKSGGTQSFKVSINSSIKDIVETSEFWPKGVKVRPFVHFNYSEKHHNIKSSKPEIMPTDNCIRNIPKSYCF